MKCENCEHWTKEDKLNQFNVILEGKQKGMVKTDPDNKYMLKKWGEYHPPSKLAPLSGFCTKVKYDNKFFGTTTHDNECHKGE